MAAKLELPFPVLSDPDGRFVLRPFDLWRDDPGEPKPAVLVLAPSGAVVLRHVGRHDSDRPELSALLDLAGAWVGTNVQNRAKGRAFEAHTHRH
jgi:hypothetical protein